MEGIKRPIAYFGRLWLYCLKRAVWLAIVSVVASSIRLAFSQSGDMAMANDSNGTEDSPICPTNTSCETLPVPCIECEFDMGCMYGSMTEASCTPYEMVECNVSVLLNHGQES